MWGNPDGHFLECTERGDIRHNIIRDEYGASGAMSMGQQVPRVSKADVERIVHRDFPAERFDEIMAMFDVLYAGREPDRVCLAVLKLADGDMVELKRQINVGRSDWRDVLGPAEYPKGIKRVRDTLSAEEKQKITDQDWQQYQHWLTRA